MSEQTPGDERGEAAGTRTSTAQWIVAALGAALVIFTLVYLAYDAFTRPDIPADIRVEQAAIRGVPGRFIVQFRARNLGGVTAAQVLVVGELWWGGALRERRQTTLEFVPPRSERGGGLFFVQDPRQGRLVLRAQGYASP